MAIPNTWTRERYLRFRDAYNKAVAAGSDHVEFEGMVILIWFAYFLLQDLHARFEH